jgi:hypothetical protein
LLGKTREKKKQVWCKQDVVEYLCRVGGFEKELSSEIIWRRFFTFPVSYGIKCLACG